VGFVDPNTAPLAVRETGTDNGDEKAAEFLSVFP